MAQISIERDCIKIDGIKTKLVSGAMHYFRIVPEYWADRLIKLKEMGCNCVETYVAWNLHEKQEGEFDFSGGLDFIKYLKTAQELGLYAIVRPGPYICSECDLGGLPWWLLKYEDIELRTYSELYLSKVRRYMRAVCQRLKPQLITNGGNVLMLQVENEFGSYGNDKKYLQALAGYYAEFDMDVPSFTSDGDEPKMLKNGTLPNIYATVNYRWDSVSAMKALKKYQPDKPGGVMELWNGRAIHCGKINEKRRLEEVELSVKGALEHAELLNLYMFHGGTNFGFFNGSLYFDGIFTVQATSYDAQAPLGEYGNKTEKYYAEQKIICGHLNIPVKNNSSEPILTNYGGAVFECGMPLKKLDGRHYSVTLSKKLLSMEECGQANGYIAYKTFADIGKSGCVVKFPTVHDIVHLYVDGKYETTQTRDLAGRYDLAVEAGRRELTFFTESLGRLHYGPQLKDKKGLLGEVVLFDKDSQKNTALTDWEIISYPFDTVSVEGGEGEEGNLPYLYKYSIDINPIGDTYIEVKGFTRGVVFINGFNLGRYWFVGPQKSLYIPKPLLKSGRNEIIIFDVLSRIGKKEVILSGKQIIEGYTE